MEQITKLSNFAQSKYAGFVGLCSALPFAIVLFVARWAAAMAFWRSGQEKIAGDGFFEFAIWNIEPRKFYLFENTYGIPQPFAEPMTYMATAGEFFLPLLLFFGFMSRFAALGLLGMTLFIQLYVFPSALIDPDGNWALHLLWAAPLLLIISRGPGSLSLDYLLGKDKTAG